MRGFTLVEVMVSFLILAAAILAFMVLYGTSLRYARYSRVNEEAVAVARSEIETLRSKEFDEVSEASYSVDLASGESCNVVRYVDDISSSLKKVTVTVSCPKGSFSVSTIISRK